MFDERGGLIGCLGLLVLVLALAVVLVLVGGNVLADIQDAAADRQQAAANLELARADRDRVNAQAWQEKFMLWTAYIEANDNDAGLVIGAVLAAVLVFAGMVGGYNLARKLEAK